MLQDCAPLKLCREVGETWEFQGVQPAVQGTIAPESLLVSPHSVATGEGLRLPFCTMRSSAFHGRQFSFPAPREG